MSGDYASEYSTTDKPETGGLWLPGKTPALPHIIDPCGGFKKHGGIFLPASTVAEEQQHAESWRQQYFW